MKHIVLMLADGFEEIEALTVKDIIIRGGANCLLCSINGDEVVTGVHDIKVKSEICIDKVNVEDFEGIVLPGGMPGAKYLRDNPLVIDLVKKFNEENKIVAAICAAPIVLKKADIIEGKNITSYPGFENELKGCIYKQEKVVRCGNIITSRGPATAMDFAYKILENLVSKEEVEKQKKSMLYEG